MKTLDLFNDRDFKKTSIHLYLPNLKFQNPYLINLKYGLISGTLMSASVYLIKQMGYAQIMLLPLFVFPLLAFGVTMSIRDYGFKTGQSKLQYFDGLGHGFLTGTISIMEFTLFMIRYFSKNNLNDLLFSPYAVVSAFFISGMAMVAVSSLGAMQYFKNYKFKN